MTPPDSQQRVRHRCECAFNTHLEVGICCPRCGSRVEYDVSDVATLEAEVERLREALRVILATGFPIDDDARVAWATSTFAICATALGRTEPPA